MNKVINYLKNKGINGYIILGSFVLILISLILLICISIKSGFHLALPFTIISLILIGVYFVFEKDYLIPISSLFIGLSIGSLFYKRYGDYIDHINKVNFWGDASLVGLNNGFIVLGIISVISLIVSGCLKKYSSK